MGEVSSIAHADIKRKFWCTSVENFTFYKSLHFISILAISGFSAYFFGIFQFGYFNHGYFHLIFFSFFWPLPFPSSTIKSQSLLSSIAKKEFFIAFNINKCKKLQRTCHTHIFVSDKSLIYNEIKKKMQKCNSDHTPCQYSFLLNFDSQSNI